VSDRLNVDTNRQVQRAIAIGETNKRVLELVQNWCAHVVVEKQGWGGLVEQMSDLPIGPRSLTCTHATAPGFSGMDLKFIALDFHDRNCVGCAHRKPVRLPNLSELIHERDQAAAASAAESARRDAAEAAALQKRDAKRQALRADLDPTSADVIDQIEELDHQRRGAAADRLAETAKLAPDVFTPPLVQYLFGLIEAGESWFDSAGLRMLAALSVDRARLARCALLCIPRIFATETAVEILLGNIEFADDTMIGGAVPELISMANPRRSPLAGDERRPNPAPLLRVYEIFPKAIEKAITTLLDRSDPYEVGRAARGIWALGNRDPNLPVRFARPLIAKFLRDRRLLRASEHYAGDSDGETVSELRQAAALAFEAAPAEIDKLLRAFLAGASEVADARIISIYRKVLRRPQFEHETEVTEASRLALERAVWRATETNSQEVLRGIFDLTSSSPWGLTGLAAAEVRHLLGAAILIEDKARRSSDPSPVIEEQQSLAALERANRLRLQNDLRGRFIAWAAAGAGQTKEGTDVYLEVLAGLPSDTDDRIKIDMVGHLHELMQTTEGITAVLPQLYTALVGGSVALRANAVRAIGELNSGQQDKLPRLVFEAFMALLHDPYRMVHKSAVYALRRTRLPDEFKPRARAGLLYQLACYMGDRQDDHFFVDCLDFYLASHATPEERTGKLGSWAIASLEKIEPWYVARETRMLRRSLRENDRYVELLIRLIGDAHAWDIYHEELTRALADLPAQSAYVHRDELAALATMAQVQGRHMDGIFVEIFTRAGAWDMAATLARTTVVSLPDDTWNRPAKLAAEHMRLATAFEAALAAGCIDQVKPIAAEWKAIAAAIEEDWTKNAERRDPLRGLRSAN
jgi:hypothetical protein